MGCSACPKDTDETIKTPKMAPDGSKSATVYLLGSSPTKEEDEDNQFWVDKAGSAIYEKFGQRFMYENVRSNFIVQCYGARSVVEIECCRSRIVADIEATKPLVVVTIGDDPFYWATKVDKGGVIPHRGTLFAAKIGNHQCYVYPLMYPNFVFKKNNWGKSEYELALEHDIRFLKSYLNSQDFQPAQVWQGPYDAGIEIITGDAPGDLIRLQKALDELASFPLSAVDIETNGLRPYFLKDPKMWMVAVGTFERTVAFPLDHPDGWGTEGRRRQVWDMFLRYLLKSGRKCAHNLAMEMEWFTYFLGGKLLHMTEWDDTMAMCHTLDSRPGTKSLDMQTTIHFGFSLKSLSNIDVTRILEYPLAKTLLYCALDTKWTDGLARKLRPLVAAENQTEYDRKIRLAPTLVLTETKGIPYDPVYAKRMQEELKTALTTIEAKLRRTDEVKAYGTRFGSFSPTNPDHVLTLMKTICKRDEIRVEEKKGGVVTVRMTTDEEALSKISKNEVPSASLILEHRASAKLLSTYVEPIITKRIICADGMIRSKYGSMTAITGRLNSEDPNIQNWPKRKHREIRGIIYAPKGEWIAALDYGQIEFRVVGMASEDKNLVKACWTGYDVHKFWAERMVALYPAIKDYIVGAFEIDWDEKGLKTLRQEAKNGWVFPQLFGASIRSCAEQLHLPDDVAEELGQEFWDEFRGVKKWQDNLLKSYEKNLYVETLGGRKRRGPQSKNEIINHPIQGTAADIVTEAMCALSERAMIEDDPDLQPNLNVHDDLSFWLPDSALDTKIEIIATEMCKPRFSYINVPLVVEASVGSRWHELKEIKVYRSDVLFNTPNPYQGLLK